MHRFHELHVYKRSLRFTRTVRQIVKGLPRDEQFVLSSQFRRAADSISLNISEGAGNDSVKEFSRFLSYSIRSGYECVSCLDIALENAFIDQQKYSEAAEEIQEMIAMLVALRQSPIVRNLIQRRQISYRRGNKK